MTTLKQTAQHRSMSPNEQINYDKVLAEGATFSANAQVDAWIRLFTKVNAIVLERRIPVEKIENAQYPAFTDGTKVVFNVRWINTAIIGPMRKRPEVARKHVAMLKGINYHELGHVLFSPSRKDSAYSRALSSEAYRAISDGRLTTERQTWGPANLIEDQRIETLFSTMYTGAKLYFRASTLLGMLTDPKTGQPVDAMTGFIFSHGRRFLHRSLRLKYRADARAEVGDEWVDDWMRVVDEYVTLNLVDDCPRAAELTVEATLLLTKLGKEPEAPDHGSSQPGNDKPSQDKDKAREASKRAKSQVAEAAEEEAEEEANSAGDGEEPEEDATSEDEDGESGKGESDDESDESDEDADTDGGDGTADDDADDDMDTDGGKTDNESEPEEGATSDSDKNGDDAGEESDSDEGGYSDQSDDSDYTPSPQTVEDALEDLLNDTQFQSEIESMVKEFQTETERGAIEHPKKLRVGYPTTPTSEESGITNRLFRILQQMRADAGASRERQMDQGKVNVIDFATRNPWDLDIFEYFEEGREDEFDMEVVVLLDMSPSMDKFAQRASLALWQIKLAMQRFDVPVTVYGYNDDEAKCLYAPTDMVKPAVYENFGSGGFGTDPLDALTRAYNIISRSSATRKILVTITDGAWNFNTRYQSDALVHRINQFPGTTSIIIGLVKAPGSLLFSADRSSYHQHQLGVEVMDPTKILDVFKEYVLHVGRSALQR